MTDLKPCPFCGHYAYVTYWGKILFATNSENGDCFTVSCNNCDASISAESEDEVVKRWNIRWGVKND